jgi:hypothetical protein
MNNNVDRGSLPTWPPEKEIVEYDPYSVNNTNKANWGVSTTLTSTHALANSNGSSYSHSASNPSEGD